MTRRTIHHETRRRLAAEFKAKIALVAIPGRRALRNSPHSIELHPNLITRSKRQPLSTPKG